MKKELLVINACVRQNESRTLRIAELIVAALSDRYKVIRYDISEMEGIIPLNPKLFEERGQGDIPAWAVKAAKDIAQADRIIIAADHGTSRMAVKVRNTEYDNAYPKPDNVGVYKYGRFCEGTEDEPKYPTAINYNERLIFADYSRFVQSGAPIDEIHGGASLEEWIVPIITVERNIGEKPETVEVKPKTTKFKPALGTKQVKVVFSISGKKRQNVSARIKGNSYKCEWADGLYSFTFVPSKADGKLTVRIADGGILGQFDIEIEQGIKKNTNFDI